MRVAIKWLGFGLAFGLIAAALQVILIELPLRFMKLALYTPGRFHPMRGRVYPYEFDPAHFGDVVDIFETAIRVWFILAVPLVLLVIAVSKRIRPDLEIRGYIVIAAIICAGVFFGIVAIDLVPVRPRHVALCASAVALALLPTLLSAKRPAVWTLFLFMCLFFMSALYVTEFGLYDLDTFWFATWIGYPFFSILSLYIVSGLWSRLGLGGLPGLRG